MKKLLILVCLLMAFGVNAQWTSKSVKVDKELRNTFRALAHLYKQKDIDIDYKQILKVVYVNKDTGWVGLYDPKKRIVYVNGFPYASMSKMKRSTKLALIMAHEMAHSQGIDHSLNYKSIMYPSSQFIIFLIQVQTRVTDLALTPYQPLPDVKVLLINLQNQK